MTNDRVVTRGIDDNVSTGIDDVEVITRTAFHQVVAGTTVERVRTDTANKRVILASTE